MTEFEVWQDDMPVAWASSTAREDALREAMHYVTTYLMDGPVKLYEVERTLIGYYA